MKNIFSVIFFKTNQCIKTKAFTSASIFCLVLVCGCTTTAMNPIQATLPTGHGVLVARTISNLSNNSSTPLNQSGATLNIEEVQTGKKYEILNSSKPTDKAGLFFAALPPGSYHLELLTSWKGPYKITATLSKQTKDFEVKTGRITDIGAIVMAFNSAGALGGSYRTSIISNENDTKTVLKMLPHSILSDLSDPTPLRSDISMNPMDNNQEIAFAKRTASVTSYFLPENGKTAVFGRALGIVSLWNPNTQQWTSFDTGSSFSIHSVAALPDGSQLMGSEYGMLFKNEQGKIRTLTPPGDGTVIFVGQSTEGEYLAVLRDKKNISVYGTHSLQPTNWHELKSFSLQRPYYAESPAIVGMTGNSLVVIIGNAAFSSDKSTIHNMDLASRNWNSYSTEFPSLEISISGNGSIRATSGTAYTRKLNLSTDFGKSWTTMPLDNWIAKLIVKDAKKIYAKRLDNIGVFSAKDSVTTLLKSNDGGATWSVTGELPKFTTYIYPLPKEGWLAADTLIGHLYISKDDGQTWENK